MKKRTTGLGRKALNYILITVLLTGACTQQKKTNSMKNIHLSWELISNPSKKASHAKAAITMHNKSKQSLGASNWLLYFNMLPHEIIPSSDTALADVVHINGDWYKLVPRNNFKLEIDAAITIYYEFEGFQIKETDAPIGLYFVSYDQEGTEEAVVPVDEYTILPFTKAEQIMRTENDCEVLPSVENRYKQYKKALSDQAPNLLPLIPSPVSYERTEETCQVDSSFKILCDESSEQEAGYLSEKLYEVTGLSLTVERSSGMKKPGIYLVTNGVKGDSPEAYNLEIKPGFIQISGEKAGIFYGIQSLLKMIPYETFRNPSGPV